MEAQGNLHQAGSEAVIAEVTADRGYHSTRELELCQSLGIRTYIAEPRRPHRRRWQHRSAAERRAVYENRRRLRRAKGRLLQRQRSERVERSFAHICDTGGVRRCTVRGLIEVTKRYIIAVAAHNLGRILRKLTGIGKPRTLQGLRRKQPTAQIANPPVALSRIHHDYEAISSKRPVWFQAAVLKISLSRNRSRVGKLKNRAFIRLQENAICSLSVKL